jgi:hypothetical protein
MIDWKYEYQREYNLLISNKIDKKRIKTKIFLINEKIDYNIKLFMKRYEY